MIIIYLLGSILTSRIFTHVLAAVIPAFLLLLYIYKKDKAEKESAPLLWSLIIYGVISAVAAGVIEVLSTYLVELFISEQSPYYSFALAFFAVASVEEGSKMFFMKKKTWNNYEFSHMFDGIVYAAFISLGFAAIENILYVLKYGFSVALLRAVLSIPGHFCFSVLMGVFYSRAKLAELRGNPDGKTANLILSYLSAVILHGIYDSCVFIGTDTAKLVFYIFVFVMYISVFITVKKSSVNDRELY